MDARRWDEVRALFDEIVELSGSERARKLAAISVTDPELRGAVDLLLQGDAGADLWLASLEPHGFAADSSRATAQFAEELQSRLQTALGKAYRIERELGGGGMSRVYVAEETAFGRRVVVKVLGSELTEGISVKRFQREIHLAAGLQHPHIVPLLSAGDAGGFLYYTMPFVEGESLRVRLRREGELPIEHVVRILRDVASALAYAHRHDVVHRDIKPENILLSEGGAVVADFGIAKALTAARPDRRAEPTTTTITQRGMALGTPLYMAPEQAAGDPGSDHRADLYALGAVAYEMLAGRPPFERASAQALMSAHTTEQPEPIEKHRPSTPPGLAALVMRCLEKRPADRPHGAAEVLRSLDDAVVAVANGWTSRPRLRQEFGLTAIHRARRLPWVLAALVIAASATVGAVLVSWLLAQSGGKASWFELALPDSAAPFAYVDRVFIPVGSSIALSRDGSTVAYVGGATPALLIRALEELEPRRLPGTEGAHCPSFSPDGRWIVFISHGRLRKIAVGGGGPIVIADSAGFCGVWTDRDEILFDFRNQLLRVPANGGTATVVVRADTARRIGSMVPSQALPGGEAALINVSEGPSVDWRMGVVSLRDGQITKLPGPRVPRYGPRYANGHLLFAQLGRGLIAVPFSLRTLRVNGPEMLLVGRTVREFSTSDDGALAYVHGALATLSLVAVREDGRTRPLGGSRDSSRADASGATPLDTARYAWPRLSPDGKRVALELKTGPFTWDIWIYDIGSRSLTRLTHNYSGVRPMGWTTDGRDVVFMSLDSARMDGPKRLVAQPWDGSAPRRELMPLPTNAHDVSLGPPSRIAAVTVAHPENASSDIWIAPLDSPATARPFIATAAWEGMPRLSPGGRMVAYFSTETGHPEIYVQSVHGPTRRVQVSEGGGRQPVWSQDGRQLYYRSPEYLMRVTLARGPELRIVDHDTLFRDVFARHNFTNYDVFPGGKELLMIRTNPSPVRAAIMLNWPGLLRQRASTR